MQSKVFLLLGLLLLGVCAYPQKQIKEISRVIAATGEEYIPDKRVGVYEIEVEKQNKKTVLKGVTTNQDAYTTLLDRIKQIAKANVVDSVQLIPDEAGDSYGVVHLSVINIRVAPQHGAEMATQALRGMPVRILQKKSWIRIQTPDGYIGWTTSGGVVAMSKEKYAEWRDADKVIVTSHYGFAYQSPDVASPTLSDIVSGNMFRLEGEVENFYQVSYPDSQIAYILKSDALPVDEWRQSHQYTAEQLIAKAKTLLGVPYLWGGTSSKGVDCSGLVKVSTFLNGLILQRDASQQAYTGEKVDVEEGYGNLEPGDLLFFGTKGKNGQKDRVIHVGIYLGNLDFIHSQTFVRINSFDVNSPLYDAYNQKRFLGARRILNAVGKNKIERMEENRMYQ